MSTITTTFLKAIKAAAKFVVRRISLKSAKYRLPFEKAAIFNRLQINIDITIRVPFGSGDGNSGFDLRVSYRKIGIPNDNRDDLAGRSSAMV
jgi:hypothetical protein